MGVFKLEDNQGGVSIISGEVKEIKGPASTFTNINPYNVSLKNRGKILLDEPNNFNTGILVLRGEVRINEDKTSKENDFVVFKFINKRWHK